MERLKTTPWSGSPYHLDSTIPTMLSKEECRYLHWLTATVWTGRGLIVEIGPWLGGSTRCLVEGMMDSGFPVENRLHVVDNFVWRDFMSHRAKVDIDPGASFEPFFRKNVKDYEHALVVHRAGLPDEAIKEDPRASKKRFTELQEVPLFEGLASEEPVEILFIDGAKSWKGMRYLLMKLSDHLEPARSYLVCQDCKYWENYWVPAMMARLADYIEPVHNTIDGTTVTFLLKEQIPFTVIESLEEEVSAVPTTAGLHDLTRAANLVLENGDRAGAMNVTLGKVCFLAHQGRIDDAIEMFQQLQDTWPWFAPILQLERASQYLEERAGVRIRRPIALAMGSAIRRTLSTVRRRLVGK